MQGLLLLGLVGVVLVVISGRGDNEQHSGLLLEQLGLDLSVRVHTHMPTPLKHSHILGITCISWQRGWDFAVETSFDPGSKLQSCVLTFMLLAFVALPCLCADASDPSLAEAKKTFEESDAAAQAAQKQVAFRVHPS